jgi:Rps23 Pro-64 3,4-dihydroxylase Tpa1-like proline 4-hydroxylase
MVINQSDLKRIAEDCAEKIRIAVSHGNFSEEPFKHFYVDNFLPVDLANLCLKAFPPLEDKIWEFSHIEGVEEKYRTKWESEFDIPDNLIYVIRILNSSLFMNEISKVMGIAKLVPDSYFTGGGLNETKKNGLLDVHIDGNYHDATGLNRRLNALIYLNPDWEQSWGGELGLYDNEGKTCVKKIAPLFNRLLVFDTHDSSFHGIPGKINFPENASRKSIVLYYYTKEKRPQDQVTIEKPHSALWKKLNFLDKNRKKTRNYY